MDSANKGVRRRNSFTIQEKVNIIKKIESGTKNRKICEEYNANSSTISTIYKNKEKILKCYNVMQIESGNPQKKKRLLSVDNALDRVLYPWFTQKRLFGEPISGILLQEKAKYFYKELQKQSKIPNDAPEFKASSGWLRNFKHRHGLRTLQVKGERASANNEESELFIVKITEMLTTSGYELDNVYNADETGLMYRCMPDRTLVSSDERDVAGHKPLKDRLTIMFCANASGTHKITPLVIGKSKKPQCFQKNPPPYSLAYTAQKKAWMSRDIFMYWFKDIFLPNVRESKPNARIMLLLDNAPTHPPAVELNAIDDKCEVVYLPPPPNVTSLIQPMDQGIISAVKRRYKTEFAKEVLSGQFDSNAEVVKFIKTWTVSSAMHVLKHCWDSITQSTLRNPWRKLLPSLITPVAEMISDDNKLDSYLNQVPGGGVMSHADVSEWLEEDHNLPVCQILSDHQLMHPEEMQNPQQNSELLDNEESEENDATLGTDSEMGKVLEAAQLVVCYARDSIELSDAEMSVLIKIRDNALNSFLSASCA